VHPSFRSSPECWKNGCPDKVSNHPCIENSKIVIIGKIPHDLWHFKMELETSRVRELLRRRVFG